jgi:hypothetical protein
MMDPPSTTTPSGWDLFMVIHSHAGDQLKMAEG